MFRENRFEYIQNFLQDFVIENKDNEPTKIATFELEHENQVIDLEFYCVPKNYKNLNFDSILALKELEITKEENDELIKNIAVLNKLENDVKSSRISETTVKRELSQFLTVGERRNLAKQTTNKALLQTISTYKNKFESTVLSDNELSLLTTKQETERNKLLQVLENEGLRYALPINESENILLYKSNVEQKVLAELSDKVYLATPNTQVLHFLSEEEVAYLFRNEN